MSHVSVYKTEPGKPLIIDIEAAKLAARNLGLEIHVRTDYRTFYTDHPDFRQNSSSDLASYAPGFNALEIGTNAVLVFSVPRDLQIKHGMDEEPYELALIRDKANPGCYSLMYDTHCEGSGLDKIIGPPVKEQPKVYGSPIIGLAPKFVQHYRMCADALSAREAGDRISFEEQEDGSWVSITEPSEARLFSAV